MTIILQNMLYSQMEYEFVNLLNKWEFEHAFELICEYEWKEVPSHKYSQELTKIFWEDRLFEIKNFSVGSSFPTYKPEEQTGEKWIFLWYDLVYRDYKITLKRVQDKKAFIKNIWDKKCISIPENK